MSVVGRGRWARKMRQQNKAGGHIPGPGEPWKGFQQGVTSSSSGCRNLTLASVWNVGGGWTRDREVIRRLLRNPARGNRNCGDEEGREGPERDARYRAVWLPVKALLALGELGELGSTF